MPIFTLDGVSINALHYGADLKAENRPSDAFKYAFPRRIYFLEIVILAPHVAATIADCLIVMSRICLYRRYQMFLTVNPHADAMC